VTVSRGRARYPPWHTRRVSLEEDRASDKRIAVAFAAVLVVEVVLAGMATQADANQAAQAAADHTSLCWIGGATGGPDDLGDVNHGQAVFYWD